MVLCGRGIGRAKRACPFSVSIQELCYLVRTIRSYILHTYTLRLLLHYMEEGKIDGLTLVFNQKQNAWVQLGQVPELKQVMRQMMEEEEQRATLENQVADSDQVFLEDSSIPVIPDEMKQAGASRGTKRSFQADNGKHFVWDDAENDWVEDENPSGSEESEDEDAHWKKGNTKDEKKTTGVSSAAAEGGEGEGVAGQDEKAAARKKKKKKKKATWNDNASGLWVYVTGLPSDVTAEELKSHFSKVCVTEAIFSLCY